MSRIIVVDVGDPRVVTEAEKDRLRKVALDRLDHGAPRPKDIYQSAWVDGKWIGLTYLCLECRAVHLAVPTEMPTRCLRCSAERLMFYEKGVTIAERMKQTHDKSDEDRLDEIAEIVGRVLRFRNSADQMLAMEAIHAIEGVLRRG